MEEEGGGWEAAKFRVMTRSNSSVNKVFVALPEECKAGKSVLNWALKAFPEHSVIVITHIHVKSSLTNLASPTNSYPNVYGSIINLERKRADRLLNNYLYACAKLKVRAEKLVFEADDVAKGLLDLITLHGVTTLVMGAAQNKHYTKNMERPTSKKAIEVMQKADPSCRIYFVCRDDLIYTREATSSASPVGVPSLGGPKLLSYLSQQLKSLPSVKQSSGSPNLRPIVHEGLEDRSLHPFEEMSTRNQIRQDELETHSDSDSSPSTDFKIEAGYTFHEIHKTLRSTSSLKKPVLRNGGMRFHEHDDYDDTYARLQEALLEAEALKIEVLAERNRRKKTERELSLAIIKAKQSDDLHQKELKERKEIEQKLGDLDYYAKDIEEKLAGAGCLLNSMQDDYDRLLKEHEISVKEAENFRNESNKMNSSSSCLGPNIKFSYAELKLATQGFSDLLKMEEDEFGQAYMGTISNTLVAVKLLHSGSIYDKLRFKQEVTILGTLRHPNLVTLVGSCQDPHALVYEHVPRSLQEHLASPDGALSLTWQMRTRIIGEICFALIFLHCSKPHAIIHGNLRPETVLIDSNFHVKLSNYGTSTFLRSTESLENSYLDPDITVFLKPTLKSDVYSFGMIILHLLTGRSPLAITGVVKEALANGGLTSVIDKSAGDWPVVQAMQLAYLGLRCAESSKEKWPDLVNDVWKVLEPIKNAASLTMSPPFGSYLDGNGVPFYFICPIFQEVMKDPQIAADGYTYEAEAIKGWLDSGHDRSPMTNLKLSHLQLIPNYPLRSAIQEWFQHQPQ
ncbi:U-box domain-containing protein kinase family protein [Rhynchospora pubera]|uniref:RING-type E3 ubiquitin transferase n=1 Tax=Rhynchospora pubera TaxID=906938 RepID=A0AAV8E3E7_9POAL|nr:U-box domain-containing protein kinase family protein [Rhynchospora pubera]